MASRTAKVASSIVAGILACAALTAPRNAARAAECLIEPGKDGTRGQHWYYRIERGTKRHCWYLRDDSSKAAQAVPSDDSSQAPNAAAQDSDDPPRSLEDAHAEYPMPQGRGATVAAPAPLTGSTVPAQPQTDTQGSAVAARWPSPDSAIAPPAAVPAVAAPAAVAQAAAPTAAADATDSVSTTDAAANAPADTPAPAAVPAAPAKPSVSLQMLFAVIGGALALAGLTASIIYRLGRGKQQRRLATSERRAVLWESVETGPRPPWVPPDIEDETEPYPYPLPERKAAQNPRAHQRHEKIEEILAQLVRQGQQSDA
jgi:hypothetical protein